MKEITISHTDYPVGDKTKKDAILCDVDGTVALMMGNRSPFEYEKAYGDKPNYPVINVVELGSPSVKREKKSFRRFLKIEAAPAQKILNEVKTDIDSGGEKGPNFLPQLGLQNSSLWNFKKFKFRIKAKDSCKVIDFNVKFVTKHTDEEEASDTCN